VKAKETVGLMQHHDALTATSYRYVLADYMTKLTSSYNDMSDVLLKLLSSMGDDEKNGSNSNVFVSSSSWTRGSIIGGGSYIYETLLVRGTQDARNISLEKIVSPQMGSLSGISLVVLNSLARDVDTVVHFVCTRPDVSISLQTENENTETDNATVVPTTTIRAQATPLEKELESPANLGLFLISFRAAVPALDKSHFQLNACDLTWSTDQHPAPNMLECAHEAKEISQDDLLQNGLSSNHIRVDFDPQTNDIMSFSRYDYDTDGCGGGAVAAPVKIQLSHDIVLYNGQNDTICNFVTNVDASNPLPLLGTTKRRNSYVPTRALSSRKQRLS
jgi:hypothetical protein